MLYGLFCRLGRPAADYPTLSGAVQAAGVASWPINDGTWFVESELSADAIRDSLALFSATLARNPDSWMAHHNLAEALAAGALPSWEAR